MKPISHTITSHAFSLLAVALIVPASSQAATIMFVSNTIVTSDAALDEPLSYPEATLVQAVTFGGSAQTVNTPGGQSISFTLINTATAADMPAAPSSSTVLYNSGFQSSNTLFPGTTGDANFDAVLRSGGWHNNASDAVRPMTVRIGGLTSGQAYLVSLFSADARTTDRAQAYWDTFGGGVFSDNTSGSFSQNPATMTVGTFTATAAHQDIFIQETDGVGNDDTNLAGFTLYAVPEPSSALLLCAAGLLAGFSRRRR